jgi:pimeloyl-ACP methyl ester carboxylesterase
MRGLAPAAATTQPLSFTNARGERLMGTLTLPEPSDGPRPTGGGGAAGPSPSAPRRAPCVILAHGYMSTRNSELLVRLATALARDGGLASLRFDFSGNGESEGRFRYGCYRCVWGSNGLIGQRSEQFYSTPICKAGHAAGSAGRPTAPLFS